ncbi:hypothetical protein HQN90_20365 [Paenibacillus alba]|uniref:hypothetical protein n=1 Tax=Paenibacillus alba TaxID=1197127 RepID=UPI001567229E|nr:hypothetical protein [Paenibacillus alba]NQX68483.1 hypothetical protein [Paenibacillus alba]
MFRFASTVRRYSVSYTLIRANDGNYDDDGVYHKGAPESIPLRGSIQPVGARLLQLEGGRYTEDDRALYTTYAHENGEIILYKGHQYTVNDGDDRADYCDTYKFMLKRVSTHDPIP